MTWDNSSKSCLAAPSGAVQAVDHVPGLLRDRDLLKVGIAHRGLDIRVAKDGPDLIDRETVLDQARSMGVPEGMDRAVSETSPLEGLADGNRGIASGSPCLVREHMVS